MSPPVLPSISGSRIVTLTMNPALDITTTTERVRPTEKIRCHGARYDAGGGGINVARIAHALGASVSAVFPAGGETDHIVADLVVKAGVRFHRIKIVEATRDSFTVNESSSRSQYRFVLPSPRLSSVEQKQCLDELRTAARWAEFVVPVETCRRVFPPTSISASQTSVRSLVRC